MNNLIKQLIQQILPICKTPTLAEQEAWWLLEAVTHKSKSQVLNGHVTLTPQERDHLAILVTQRVREHKPLQYLLGSVPFCGLTINVRPPILIPRPETEEWVTWLIDVYHKAGIATFTALDLCTGTGCIGLALAKHFPLATVVGVDSNADAIALACENKCNNNLNNITFVTSNLYAALSSTFTSNLIVSNPPYLSSDEYDQLDADVRMWEDRDALVGGHNGMLFYREILQGVPKFLQPLPSLMQDACLEQLLSELCITDYVLHTDMHGKRRWISFNLAS
jgi:release factor glutamine methyltransferase